MPQTTRIIPFTSITYIDLKDTKNTHINLYKTRIGAPTKGMRQAFQRTTQVGVGPQQKECAKHFNEQLQKGGAQQRNAKRISSSTSWVGPTETVGTSLYF